MNKVFAFFVLWMSCLAGAAQDGRLDKAELKMLSTKEKRHLAFWAAANGRIADFKKLKNSGFFNPLYCHGMPFIYKLEDCVKMPDGEQFIITHESEPLTYFDVAVINSQVEMADFLMKNGYHGDPRVPNDNDSKFYSLRLDYAAINDCPDMVDLLCRSHKRWGFLESEINELIYGPLALAVALGKGKAVQRFLSNFGVRHPEYSYSTELKSSSLFALAAVNGHPDVLGQLLESEYEYLQRQRADHENARIAAVKSSLLCLPSVLVREICAYKGAERKVFTWKGFRVENFVLPSARPDLQGKNPLDYAQAELERSTDHDERERLSECLDLLKSQDTKFMNFLFDKRDKTKS